MTYNFKDFNQLYDRVLRQIDQNGQTESSQQYMNNFGEFKLDKPKNPITTKSIYTQDQSQYFRCQAQQDCDNNDQDIHKFIENSKTLKEKIYQKLEKNKKSVHQRAKIVETTFRPTQVKQGTAKQNSIVNSQSYRKNTSRLSTNKSNLKTQRKTQQKRVVTEVDQANALWEQKGEKKMMQLGFYERQQKTLTKRKQLTDKIKAQKKQKQLQGCTFKPKLTKYKPQRS